MSIPLYRLGDVTLENDLATFKAKVRATSSSQLEAWPAIYREALGLFQRVIAANDRSAVARAGPTGQLSSSDEARQLSTALSAAQSALQQVQAAWPGRLQSQLRSDLIPKVERSIAQLNVQATRDRATGMTVYKLATEDLLKFYAWLHGVEQAWAKNNAELTALRANEAMFEALGGENPLQFTVSAPQLSLPRPCDERSPKLAGHSLQTPGTFELLGSTYKYIMTVVTAISGLGYVASNMLGRGTVGSVIPYVLGTAFVGAVVTAFITIPTRLRQGYARLLRDATTKVQEQLVRFVEGRFSQFSDNQLNATRRHLTSEAARLGAEVRKRVASLPSPNLGPSLEPAARGLPASDEEALKGAWRMAIERRLASFDQ